MTKCIIKRTMYIGAILIFALSTVFAQQTGKISGEIIDAQNGEPLIGANVIVVGTSLGASTDFEGTYFILNLPAGKYNIQVSMVGYERMVQRDVIVHSGRTTHADFKLKPTILEQEIVVVEATRPDVEPEKTSTSAIIRADEVQALAGMRDVSDVIGLAAEVTDGHFRGGRTNEELYTLQGLGIMNPLDNSSAFMPIMSAVEEIEVITSGFDAQYGNAQSGVVNITMKEGKSDRWRAKLETRSRVPGKKHWGASVYDPTANPYLQKLSDPNFWIKGDATNGYTLMYDWTRMSMAGDTFGVIIPATKAIWQKIISKDLNKNYWNAIDYSFEGAFGGPIDEGITMFLAFKSNVESPMVPTEQPDEKQQVMGNFAFDLGSGSSLKLSGGYQSEYENIFGGSTGFYTWMWDRILGIQYRKRTNHQLGLRYTKALSHRAFLEIKLNGLRTENRQGSSPYYDTITDEVRNMETGSGIISRTGNLMYYTNPTGDRFYYLANNLGNFFNERTSTISLDASYTNQITKSHLLNGGIQANYYFINVHNINNIRSKGSIMLSDYSGEPWEVGVYIQDKMEFQGMIAKIGLRWDMWNSNNFYYVDQFNPFTIKDPLGNEISDPAKAPKQKASAVGRLQPRIGISFPVSISTVFHLNYGTFLQRPPFQYMISTQYRMNPTNIGVGNLGNPRLEPQSTNSYDIGVMQGLGEGFTLDVSGWYKDVKNLVEQTTFTDARTGTSYNSYFNRAYADIRGFRVVLTKKRSALSGSVNYQYSVATGKSSSTTNAPFLVMRDLQGNVVINLDKVPVKDVLLNFDRTHNLTINASYITTDDWGPKIGNVYPFNRMVFSINMFARSGRPYTPSKQAREINTLRSPAEYNTNIRVAKTINKLFGTTAVIYAEVFNLFNNKIYNYNYLFNTANRIDGNPALERYETFKFDDINNGVLYWDQSNTGSPFGVDHNFLLYSNDPRSINLGISIEF